MSFIRLKFRAHVKVHQNGDRPRAMVLQGLQICATRGRRLTSCSRAGELISSNEDRAYAMIDKPLSLRGPTGLRLSLTPKSDAPRRSRILGKVTKPSSDWPTTWNGAGRANRCDSGACDVCLRLYRLRLFRQTGPVLALRPHWTRASVVPAGFLLPLGELVNVELKALGEMIDKRLERSSLRRRIVMVGIDISLNLQDNNIIGWQLHLYMLIEGENTLRLREAVKAAFPPERTAPIPYDFDEVNVPSNCVTYLFKAIFKRRSRYAGADGRPRTKSQNLKGPELRELLQFLDQYGIGERLILRGIRRNGRHLVIINRQQKTSK